MPYLWSGPRLRLHLPPGRGQSQVTTSQCQSPCSPQPRPPPLTQGHGDSNDAQEPREDHATQLQALPVWGHTESELEPARATTRSCLIRSTCSGHRLPIQERPTPTPWLSGGARPGGRHREVKGFERALSGALSRGGGMAVEKGQR